MAEVDLDTIGPDGWATPDTVLALVAELRVAREVAQADRWYVEHATPERIMRLKRARAAYREWCDQAMASTLP